MIRWISVYESVPSDCVHSPGTPPCENGHPLWMQFGSDAVKPGGRCQHTSQLYLQNRMARKGVSNLTSTIKPETHVNLVGADVVPP